MRQGEGGGMGLVLTCLTPRVGSGPEYKDATASALLKGLYEMRIWGDFESWKARRYSIYALAHAVHISSIDRT